MMTAAAPFATSSAITATARQPRRSEHVRCANVAATSHAYVDPGAPGSRNAKGTEPASSQTEPAASPPQDNGTRRSAS